jgi:hypothetical protein
MAKFSALLYQSTAQADAVEYAKAMIMMRNMVLRSHDRRHDRLIDGGVIAALRASCWTLSM